MLRLAISVLQEYMITEIALLQGPHCLMVSKGYSLQPSSLSPM